MALFGKRKKEVRPDITSFIPSAREYVQHQMKGTEKAPEEKKEQPQIRYSLREPSYDETRIRDMGRFVEEARKDPELFETKAVRNTYHEWEKKNAARKTFSSEVMRRLKERKLSSSAFYKSVEMDKRLFHRMKSDYCYKPSRDTAIRCCLGLKLLYREAAELLQLAGYSLSPGDSRDLAIRFCFENGITDITSVNTLLQALEEKPLLK